MILGAWLFSQLLSSSSRHQHYMPNYNSPYYPSHYPPQSPRMGTQVLFIGLLAILAFSLFIGWQRQSTPQKPIRPEPIIEQDILNSNKEAALFSR